MNIDFKKLYPTGQSGSRPITFKELYPTVQSDVRRLTRSTVHTLLVVFIVLKFAGLVTWPWWFVLSPVWGGFISTEIITCCATYYFYKFEQRG